MGLELQGNLRFATAYVSLGFDRHAVEQGWIVIQFFFYWKVAFLLFPVNHPAPGFR